MANEKRLGLYDCCVDPTVNRRGRFFTHVGSPLAKNYKMVVTERRHLDNFEKDGCYIKGMTPLNKEVPEEGEWLILEDVPTNLYQLIQSHRESCDIHLILKKYQQGDETALNRMQGFYDDVTDMPKNLADAFAMVKNAENAFSQFPLEVRKEFGHNPAAFIRSLKDGTFGEVVERFTNKAEELVPQNNSNKQSVEPKTEVVPSELKGDVTNE